MRARAGRCVAVIPDPIVELGHVLDATRTAWTAAADASGTIETVRLVAGEPVRFRFAGPALVEHLLPALCHLPEVDATDPVFTAHAWDARSTGVAVPALDSLDTPPPPARSIIDHERAVSFSTERTMLEAVDLTTHDGWFALDSPDDLTTGERGAPFRLVLHWWLAQRGLQFTHGGAVGADGSGVLVVGASGSGKSSTTLACVEAGMQYVGDDYCALATTTTPTVHSLYSSAKIFDTDAAYYPTLTPGRSALHHRLDDKSLYLVDRARPDCVVRDLALAAVVVPTRTPDVATTFRPTSAGDALQALAPSTIGQLPGSAARTLAALAAAARAVPAYRLELGTDRATVAPAVRALLDELAVSHA
jgi:hypothetical protein